MEPTLNCLLFFYVEGVVWNLHVSPVALMGIFHGYICMKKLHKPRLGRVPTETLPAWLGTGLAFLSRSAGTKHHHPGPNVFLACHLDKLNFRISVPKSFFQIFHRRGKGYHISFTLTCWAHCQWGQRWGVCPPQRNIESCNDCQWLPEAWTSGDLYSGWEIIFLDSFRKEEI